MNSLSFAIFPVFYAWSDEIELSTELAITPRARTFTTITPLALPSQIQQRVYNSSVRSVVTRQSSLYTCTKSALNVLYIYVGWFVCAHESFWFGRMKNVLFFQLLFLVHSANTYIYFNKKDVDGSTFWFDPFAVPSFACVFCVFFFSLSYSFRLSLFRRSNKKRRCHQYLYTSCLSNTRISTDSNQIAHQQIFSQIKWNFPF